MLHIINNSKIWVWLPYYSRKWLAIHEFVFINSKQCIEVRFDCFLSGEFYYCHSSKSTRKETGKTHLCNVLNSSKVLNGSLANNNWAPGSSKNVRNESYSYRFSWFVTLEMKFEMQNWQSFDKEKCPLIELSDLTFESWTDFSVQLESHCYFRIV